IQAGDFGAPHTNGACDHEGQCVLLAIWGDVGERMRALLDGYHLDDLAAMTRGELDWPEAQASAAQPVDATPTPA
ncbi:MAG TPA: hypothetical protein VJM33_01130, partial [Microthrixaceae bacterium]|nr:hypothetical protein [Microthrixaceae bacterium]